MEIGEVKMKDKCVSCGVETSYDKTDHVDFRLGYVEGAGQLCFCLLYTSPSPRDGLLSRMPSSA